MTKKEMLEEIKEVLHDCRLELMNYRDCKVGLAEDVIESLEDKIEELEGS